VGDARVTLAVRGPAANPGLVKLISTVTGNAKSKKTSWPVGPPSKSMRPGRKPLETGRIGPQTRLGLLLPPLVPGATSDVLGPPDGDPPVSFSINLIADPLGSMWPSTER